MPQFKDAKGGSWDISLPFGAITEIKKASDGKFDLLEPFKDDLADKINRNWGEFFEVLWFLVESQAQEREVTATQFGRLMAAECLLDAHQKFFKEWADFFRKLQRENVAIALETMAMVNAKAIEMTSKRLATETTGLEEKITPKINEVLNHEFGNLQELLDKTLGPSPGVS